MIPISLVSHLAAFISSTDGDFSGADICQALPGWTCDGSSLYGLVFNYSADDGWDAGAAEDSCRVQLAEAVSLREGEVSGEDVVLDFELDAGDFLHPLASFGSMAGNTMRTGQRKAAAVFSDRPMLPKCSF